MLKNVAKFGAIAIVPMMIVGCSAPMDSSFAKINETVNVVDQIVQNNVGSADSVVAEFENVAFSSSSSSFVPDVSDDYSYIFDNRTVLTVDACDLSGNREPNVVVDVGYGDREYWAYTNQHGQLIGVVADEVVLQKKNEELSNGRYCWDEAKVPGVESSTLDEGHVIADSLGGVSNAYNITPQDSYVNRYGDQSKLEGRIRDAGGAKNVSVEIVYPNTRTQTPNKYIFTLTYNNGHTESISFNNG